MKKALRGDANTGCSKAEPKNFALPQSPLPEARDGQSLISWIWSLPLPINPVWWGSMRAISSYRGNRPHKKTHTHTHPQTGVITIYCAATSLTHSVKSQGLCLSVKQVEGCIDDMDWICFRKQDSCQRFTFSVYAPKTVFWRYFPQFLLRFQK